MLAKEKLFLQVMGEVMKQQTEGSQQHAAHEQLLLDCSYNDFPYVTEKTFYLYYRQNWQ